MDPLLVMPYLQRRVRYSYDEMFEEDKKRHDALVPLIARSRFAFPSKVSPSLRTYLNLPKRAISVAVSNSETLCPDIVVVNEVTRKAVTIAEIETEMTIDNQRAIGWRKCSSIHDVNFYLFAPQTRLHAIRELVRFFRIRVRGLRIYTYNNFGEPIISEV